MISRVVFTFYLYTSAFYFNKLILKENVISMRSKKKATHMYYTKEDDKSGSAIETERFIRRKSVSWYDSIHD